MSCFQRLKISSFINSFIKWQVDLVINLKEREQDRQKIPSSVEHIEFHAINEGGYRDTSSVRLDDG